MVLAAAATSAIVLKSHVWETDRQQTLFTFFIRYLYARDDIITYNMLDTGKMRPMLNDLSQKSQKISSSEDIFSLVMLGHLLIILDIQTRTNDVDDLKSEMLEPFDGLSKFAMSWSYRYGNGSDQVHIIHHKSFFIKPS